MQSKRPPPLHYLSSPWPPRSDSEGHRGPPAITLPRRQGSRRAPESLEGPSKLQRQNPTGRGSLMAGHGLSTPVRPAVLLTAAKGWHPQPGKLPGHTHRHACSQCTHTHAPHLAPPTHRHRVGVGQAITGRQLCMTVLTGPCPGGQGARIAGSRVPLHGARPGDDEKGRFRAHFTSCLGSRAGATPGDRSCSQAAEQGRARAPRQGGGRAPARGSGQGHGQGRSISREHTDRQGLPPGRSLSLS